MATQVVELTGDEASLLRSLQKVIEKEVEMEKKLQNAGNTADAAGTQIAGAMERIQRESDKALQGLLGDLKGLGPEGQAAANAVKAHLQESGKAGSKSFDQIVKQLKLIDPAAATAAQSAADAMAEAGKSASASWNEQIALLRSLGPEGATAAKAIESDLAAAAAHAAGGMDQVLRKLEALNPEAATAAAKIRSQLGDAAQYSEREFGDVLSEMRALGPEGKRAADAIRRELIAAGKIAEKSIEDVAAKFDAIDPQAAAAARKVVSNMKTAGTESGTVIDGLATKVASYVAGMGAASSVLGTIKRLWEQIRKEQDDGLKAMNATQDTDRQLLQISTSDADFASLQKQRDDLSAQYGVDRNETSQVIFGGRSLGYEDAVPEIVRASQVLDPVAASDAGGKLKVLFENENKSATQMISAMLKAATISSADFEDLAAAVPTAAEGGSQLGASSVQTIAATAILATDFKDAGTAADRVKGFTSKAAQDERFKGKDIVDVVKQLDAMQPEERKDFLKGSDELNAAYTALSRRVEQIASLAGDMNKDMDETAQGRGELNSKLAIAERNPVFIARKKEAMAQRELEVTQANEKGIEGAVASTAAAGAKSRFLKEDNFVVKAAGEGVFGLGLTNLFSGVAAALGANEEQATEVAVGGTRGVVGGIYDTFAPGLGTLIAPQRRKPQSRVMQQPPKLIDGVLPAQDASMQQPPNLMEGVADPGAAMKQQPVGIPEPMQQQAVTDPELLEEQRKQTLLLQRQNELLEQNVSNTEPKPGPPMTPALAADQP